MVIISLWQTKKQCHHTLATTGIKTKWLANNVFAIMASWLSFPEKYWKTLFSRLDKTVVNEDGIENQPINHSILENNIEKSQIKETQSWTNVFLWEDQKQLLVGNYWIKLQTFRLGCTIITHVAIYTTNLVTLIEILTHAKDANLILEKPAVRNMIKSSKFSTLPRPKLKTIKYIILQNIMLFD